MNTYVAAVDLGASSGRVLLACLNAEQAILGVEEVHRFENGFVRRNECDCWDVDTLVDHIELGLETILARGIVPASVGVDTWGVDFVLLDAQDRLLGEAVSYRDHRTDGVMEQAFRRVPRETIYARTGLQFMQFNTLYQLLALLESRPCWLPRVRSLLLMADYLHFRLCGIKSCEYTNASTSQLLNLSARDWDGVLIDAFGIPGDWLMPLCQPGTRLGEWISRDGTRVPVITPPTHDTAAAVLATPLQDDHAVYISSGTWSLMGVESAVPHATPAALAANLTHEGGCDGSYRILKNIMGLWLIQRVRDAFPTMSFADLVEAAQNSVPFAFLIRPNDDRFLNPPSMTEAIAGYCEASGQGRPHTAGEFARCVFESLAFLYRQTLDELRQITGLTLNKIHIVGGGSQNEFLDQLCADFCACPVQTGPVEASALGNIVCQLRALGCLSNTVAARALIRRQFSGATLIPRPDHQRAADCHWLRFTQLPALPVRTSIAEGVIS